MSLRERARACGRVCKDSEVMKATALPSTQSELCRRTHAAGMALRETQVKLKLPQFLICFCGQEAF